ncbi:uncharacterized protein LOC131025891 [Salvia miltiorrhiza]|uniref:uncharacterized protein LOC131025891 n=1 Tax=Salvia miltiorrhiza TaxID=226208 RepID=UPI0025ACCD64|nr:uncharacterized protein LOC131025891 [Salvia miltiorrhiza]
MGKGYFTLKFSSAEDKAKAKKHLIWELSTGTIRIREWVKMFDPYREISSLCHVWVRIYYLPVECWYPEIITGIGHHIGLPLQIDSASAHGEFGHFARLLIEIDLSLPLPETLLVNCDEGSFYVEFGYEQLPLYCSKCKITGHSTDKCRKGTSSTKEAATKDKTVSIQTDKAKETGKNGKDKVKDLKCKAKEPEGDPHNTNKFACLSDGDHTEQGCSYGLDLLEKILISSNNGKDGEKGVHDRVQEEPLEPEASDEEDYEKDEEVEEEREKESEVVVVFEEIEQEQRRTEVTRVVDLEKDTAANIPVVGESSSTLEVTKPTKKDVNGHVVEQQIKVARVVDLITSGSSKEKEIQVKKRGRPPKSEISARKHTQEEGIKGRLRKQEQATRSREVKSASEYYIHKRMSSAIAEGQQPQNYTVENSTSPSARSMDNIAARSWAAEMESGENPTNCL